LADDTIAQLAEEYDWAVWRAKKADGGLGGMRIQDSPNALVRRIAGNPCIIELLSQLYGRPAFPFQTLNFPVGTEQPFHADAVHFSGVPERFMCGVWVALEDIGPEQGLVYYPDHTSCGSIPTIRSGSRRTNRAISARIRPHGSASSPLAASSAEGSVRSAGGAYLGRESSARRGRAH
jgi:hypothetical protein